MGNNTTSLPPGFRFCPTDEELVVHFLQHESVSSYHPDIIPDLHLYPYDPWELDGKAMAEGRKWYYYSRKTQNRMTENGYWKAWDGEEGILSSNGDNKRIGVKKYYVFHIGEAPQGTKTNWIMEEFRAVDSNGASTSGGRSKRRHHLRMDYSKRVICHVYEHNYDNNENYNDDNEDGVELSCLDEFYMSIEDFDDASYPS
ncbi:NAC domain-containing protein 104-like [Bidens hawaiensis]|uniref:NAC domain-containing protein 104-like n=1 Tax=Bidens hawaiensis TaxID=980011 RepID=UPI004049D41F